MYALYGGERWDIYLGYSKVTPPSPPPPIIFFPSKDIGQRFGPFFYALNGKVFPGVMTFLAPQGGQEGGHALFLAPFKWKPPSYDCDTRSKRHSKITGQKIFFFHAISHDVSQKGVFHLKFPSYGR